MKRQQNNRKWGAIIGVVSVIIIVGIGLFFYHNFFRQTHGELVETIPSDASFILQINDNGNFVKSSSQLLPYLSEILTLDALPGFQFFMDKFPEKNGVIISCHQKDGNKNLLFSTRISELEFKELLKNLRIDPRNYIPFDNVKIYTFGTHFKKFNFTFHNNCFSISEDVELLKKSIVQIKNPRNLLSNKEFSAIYESIIKKNNKQNWLILQNKFYFEDLKYFFSDNYHVWCDQLTSVSDWCAFVIRLNDKEMSLSGYAMDKSPFFSKFDAQPASGATDVQVVPFASAAYVSMKTPDPTLFSGHISERGGSLSPEELHFFNKLLPVSTTAFQLEKDTVAYHYIAVKIDTTISTLDAITPDSVNASVTYKKHAIFQTEKGRFNSLLSVLHNNIEMGCYVEYQGHYIFSDTITSLQYYIDNMKNSFANQPLYKFAKTNIPSENNFEFCFIAPESDRMQPYSSIQASRSQIMKGIQVFSYSFSAPQRGFVPVNIYLKMR
ncbi:hypothetical protein LJC68_06290 [Bacteroidales bacterium OttesenSCG-928-B11]|nr:hypothetical protein [Bacteroidales bacterium OttesenSCG-928-C03]MDL2312469.1 hypothetical protein [Bacteroidales bacterium OttesenSCG-928-B11]MDL2326534.1 hypothetical protein [Bacteroidales bacterium OttesenSCG-928-A14]